MTRMNFPTDFQIISPSMIEMLAQNSKVLLDNIEFAFEECQIMFHNIYE